MKRRTFMATSAAAALPLPSLAQPARDRTLIFAPRTGLGVLDPIFATGAITSAHGYCVFDTLYAIDDNYRAHPQMAEGHTVSDDRLTWSIRLRPGLKWHDGEPVLSRDCVASLQRWSKKDTFGALLARVVEAWETPDDRTIRIRLREPFEVLPDALAHPSATAAFMMPERLARTPHTEQVKEMVGSGPLRFVKDEYLPGHQVVYSRFEGYVPRDEAPQGTMGGKRMHFDRLEWRIIPDDATAASALQKGEIDWWELVNPDIVPVLMKDSRVRVEVYDRLGIFAMLKFNTINPPFDNPKLRRAVLAAVEQSDFMQIVAGDVPQGWRSCHAMFPCGVPGNNEVGKPLMAGPKDMAKLREMVAASGYKGEQAVILSAADYPMLSPLCGVAADLLTKLGIAVQVRETDYATLLQHRNNRGPVDKGGWSAFVSLGSAAVSVNAGLNVYVQAEGAKSWYGWYDNPAIVALTRDWARATSAGDRERLTDAIQSAAFAEPPGVPIGQYFPRTAFHAGVTGFLPGPIAVPWNIRRV